MLGSIQSSYTHGDGRQVLFESGLLADQCDGAVVVTSHDTQILVTVVAQRPILVERPLYVLGKVGDLASVNGGTDVVGLALSGGG